MDSAPLSEEESEDVLAVPSPSRGVVFQIRRAANGHFCLVTRVGALICSLVGPASMVSLVTEAGAPALVGIRVVRGVPMPTGGPGWSTAISVPTGVSMFGVTPSGTMLVQCLWGCRRRCQRGHETLEHLQNIGRMTLLGRRKGGLQGEGSMWRGNSLRSVHGLHWLSRRRGRTHG